MARNALEAVFGALGGGLVGYGRDKQIRYGQEQDAIDREERRKRTELADALQAAEMLESGRWGTEAQSQGRRNEAGNTAMQAAMFAATRGAGKAPMPSAVARAVPQLNRPEAPKVSVGGQDLRLLENEREAAMQDRAARIEDAAMQRQQRRADEKEQATLESELRRGDVAAGEQERRRTTEVRLRSTGLSPQDRAYQATLQFANTAQVNPLTGERTYPSDEDVAAFAERAKSVEPVVYGGRRAAPAAAPKLSEEAWATQNPPRQGESYEQYKARYNAYAATHR